MRAVMPLGDVTILDQIESEIVAALQPMLVPFDADGLKQIEIEPFNSGEEIAVLLTSLRSRLPAAYLNIPSIDYLTDTNLRADDFTLNYAFLIGLENVRSKTYLKKQVAYYFHEKFHREMFYRKINNCEIPANLDYIRPQRFEVAEADNMMVTLTTFSIRVRNWLVREPER